MTVRWLDPLNDETDLLAEVEQRYTGMSTIRRQATNDPQLPARVAQLAYNFGGYTKPGVITGMAQAGLDADHPVAQQIARMAGETAARQTGTADYGEKLNGSVMQKAWGFAKANLRGGLMLLAAPFEEASALISSVGEAAFDDTPGMADWSSNYTDRAARSGLAMTVADLGHRISEDGFQLSDVDEAMAQSGEGILPGGNIMARREADKQRLQLDEQFVTPGRLISRAVTEPGTRPYNFVSGIVDFTANIVADPATWVTGGMSKASAASKVFGVAVDDLPLAARVMAKSGLVRGARSGVLGETVEEFLSRPAGGLFLKAVAGQESPSRIWQAFGGKITREEAVAMAKAETPVAARDTVLDILGTRVREKPSASMFDTPRSQRTYGMPGTRRQLHGVRFMQEMPKQVIDLNDPVKQVSTLDAYMRNVKFADAKVHGYLDEWMRTDPHDIDSHNGIVTRINEDIIGDLITRGKSPEQARELTTRMAGKWAEFSREARAFLVDKYGNDIIPPWARNTKTLADGTEIPEIGGVASLATHARGDFIVLPDVRELRRATSLFGKVYDTPVIGGMSKTAVDLLSEKVMPAWKTLAILRPALGVRVILDEQARMAAHGDGSLLTHPLQIMAYAFGRKGAHTPSGTLVSEFAKDSGALSARLRQVVGDRVNVPGYMGDYMRGTRDQPGASGWWFSYLTRFATDEISQEVAGRSGRTIRELQDAFWDGDLKHLRESLIRDLRADRKTGQIPGGLNTRAGADSYLVDTVQKSLWDATGGNHAQGIPGDPDLLAGLAQGRILDYDLHDGLLSQADHRAMNTATIAQLGSDYKHAMPPVIPRPRVGVDDPAYKQKLDRATDRLFGMFLAHPSDRFSRIPTYTQSMWREMDRLIPYMTEDVAREVIAAAKREGLGDLAAKMTKRAGRGPEDARLDKLLDVETLAHAVALDDTRKLLYDLANRGQFSDILRIVAPFAEPWKEVMTTWGRLTKANPGGIARRAHQGLQGLRTADPDGDGKGFFYNENGTEYFAYPGGHLVGKLLGLPGRVDLTGRASGMNMVASSFLPGLGPVMQIPAGMLIPDRPQWDGFRELVLPYGSPADEAGTPGGVLDAMLPAYMKRVVTAVNADPNGDRIYANTVTDVMRLLASTGKYDNPQGMIDADAQIRLLADAKVKAKQLYWVRALAQSTLPTGPEPRYSVDTPEGLVAVQALSEEYRKMQQDEAAGGFDTALERFVDRFGYDVAFAVTPKSKQIKYRPATKVGADWERENADIIEQFPTVAGYFAPDDPEGEFDFAAYMRALKTGAREALSPDEVVQLHNNTLGRLAYDKAQQDLGALADTPDGQAVLSRIRIELREAYPGFQTMTGVGSGASTDVLIGEFRRAIEHPKLADTQVGQATAEWLRLRDMATAAASQIDSRVKSFASARSAAPVRQWLREEAEALVKQYPEWAGVFDRVFSRELDVEEEAPMLGQVA